MLAVVKVAPACASKQAFGYRPLFCAVRFLTVNVFGPRTTKVLAFPELTITLVAIFPSMIRFGPE